MPAEISLLSAPTQVGMGATKGRGRCERVGQVAKCVSRPGAVTPAWIPAY
jgi:hypothetical protein